MSSRFGTMGEGDRKALLDLAEKAYQSRFKPEYGQIVDEMKNKFGYQDEYDAWKDIHAYYDTEKPDAKMYEDPSLDYETQPAFDDEKWVNHHETYRDPQTGKTYTMEEASNMDKSKLELLKDGMESQLREYTGYKNPIQAKYGLGSRAYNMQVGQDPNNSNLESEIRKTFHLPEIPDGTDDFRDKYYAEHPLPSDEPLYDGPHSKQWGEDYEKSLKDYQSKMPDPQKIKESMGIKTQTNTDGAGSPVQKDGASQPRTPDKFPQ